MNLIHTSYLIFVVNLFLFDVKIKGFSSFYLFYYFMFSLVLLTCSDFQFDYVLST